MRSAARRYAVSQNSAREGIDHNVPEIPMMFRRVLVPLDGSALAEQALAPACRIVEKFDSELLLLRVVAPERRMSSALIT